jgi:hypothetical protein
MRRFVVVSCVYAALCLVCGSASAVTPPGIVFEAEDISQPADAWARDRSAADHWNLWTREQDIEKKRSRKAVLASPSVKADRTSPEEGAPPLHSIVRGLKPGLYQVYVSAPGRPLAYSLDGRQWQRYAGGELNLGQRRIGSQPFEIWIDDRFAAPPGDPGPGYFDYLRFVSVPECSPNVRREEAFSGLELWLNTGHRGFGVFIGDLELSGFVREGNGGRLRGGELGDSFAYVVKSPDRYWPALAMADSPGAMEELDVAVNGRKVGHIAATGSDGEPALFCFSQPVELRAGDRLSFTCTSKADYRIEKLLLATVPDRIARTKVRVPCRVVGNARPGRPVLDHQPADGDRPGGIWHRGFSTQNRAERLPRPESPRTVGRLGSHAALPGSDRDPARRLSGGVGSASVPGCAADAAGHRGR